jgi:hypothetical protein
VPRAPPELPERPQLVFLPIRPGPTTQRHDGLYTPFSLEVPTRATTIVPENERIAIQMPRSTAGLAPLAIERLLTTRLNRHVA